MRRALIIVDVQNDFISGSLAVRGGEEIVPIINECVKAFRGRGVIVATRDWHPPNHISFEERGGPWPAHCVQGTKGAEFHKDLDIKDAIIVSKAMDPDKDAYSGFQGTELEKILKERGVSEVFVCGIATDYCVKNTAIDALKLGFKVNLLMDAIRGVDPVESERTIEELRDRGVNLLVKEEVMSIMEEEKKIEEEKKEVGGEERKEEPKEEKKEEIKEEKKEQPKKPKVKPKKKQPKKPKVKPKKKQPKKPKVKKVKPAKKKSKKKKLAKKSPKKGTKKGVKGKTKGRVRGKK